MSKLIKEEIIHFKSTSLLPLSGEESELVNEGKYGKAVCQFLETELKGLGFKVIRYVVEDWGWWIEVENTIKSIELGVYCNGVVNGVAEYAVNLDTRKSEFFKLASMKKVSRVDAMLELRAAIHKILEASMDTEVVSVSEDFPF